MNTMLRFVCSFVAVRQTWHGFIPPPALLVAVTWRTNRGYAPTFSVRLLNSWAVVKFGPDCYGAWIGEFGFIKWRTRK